MGDLKSEREKSTPLHDDNTDACMSARVRAPIHRGEAVYTLEKNIERSLNKEKVRWLCSRCSKENYYHTAVVRKDSACTDKEEISFAGCMIAYKVRAEVYRPDRSERRGAHSEKRRSCIKNAGRGLTTLQKKDKKTQERSRLFQRKKEVSWPSLCSAGDVGEGDVCECRLSQFWSTSPDRHTAPHLTRSTDSHFSESRKRTSESSREEEHRQSERRVLYGE